MRIQCPLNGKSVEHIDGYIEYGADEFFFGYRNTKFGDKDLLNRRFGKHTNFDSFDSAKSACSQIKQRGKKAYIVLNELYYPEEWHDILLDDVCRFADCGADGFIVSDLNMLIKLKEKNRDFFIVLSSAAHVLNTAAAKFYKPLGIKRLILPRQLSVSEILTLLGHDRNLEYELMIMNEECPHLEGICSYSHLPGEDSPNMCRQALMFNKVPAGMGYIIDSCGACSLYSFKEYPELVLKIVGRGIGADWIQKDLYLIKNAMTYLDTCESAQDFANYCAEQHSRIFLDKCRKKCYYPVDYLPDDEITGGEIPSGITFGVVKYLSSLPHPSLSVEPGD